MSVTKEELQDAVSSSSSMRQVLEKLYYSIGGEAYRHIGSKIKGYGIEASHLNLTDQSTRITLSSVEKDKVRKELGNTCSECGLGTEWMSKPITLQVDHINGDRYDNSKENLRLLCPNCHTQTETYSGRRFKKPKCLCLDCGCALRSRNKRCRSCAAKAKHVASGGDDKWPSDSDLCKMIWNYPFTKVGEIIGVSDVAVKKRCLQRGIEIPRSRMRDGSKT